MTMTKTHEAKPNNGRRRHATYGKRFEMRVSDAELEFLELFRSREEEATGRRPGLSEAARRLIRDRGMRVAKAIVEAGSVSPEQRKQRTEAMENLAEELRLLRTDNRRIKHNAHQLNSLVRAAHQNAGGGVPEVELARLQHTVEALREDMRLMDQKLVQMASEVTGHTGREG